MQTTNMYSLQTMSDEESWSMFSQVALSERSSEECAKLKDVGRNIVDKCKGFPFPIKILGSLLRFRKTIEEWQSVLDSEIWELKEVENELFRSLLLSYFDFPSTLRRCFSYCAIFPKDYKIERKTIVRLWMAQSYLMVRGDEDMELTGEQYFNNLVARSFFRDFELSEVDGSIISCKMHDIVHDFVRFLSKNECFTIEVDGLEKSQIEYSYRNAQHSMVMLKGGALFPISVSNEKKLSSLVIERRNTPITKVVLSKLFDQLTCLRSLDLSNDDVVQSSIRELPTEINQLIQLRYLNLSKNQMIEKLPETMCQLFNLETLDLSWCSNLKRLPEGIGELINLRHLEIERTDALSHICTRIERLTCLRTLSKLVVSGRGHDSKACSIRCLKNLNYLGGTLVINGLGNIDDVIEAKEAELKNKKKLRRLGLTFDRNQEKGDEAKRDEEKRRLKEDDEELLKALEPPADLERLGIYFYIGNTINPNWLTSLTKLRMLTLTNCLNCYHLPPLGILPSLESLQIRSLRSVRKVGKEFLGIETNSTSSVTLFPKLKALYFWSMKEWEEWDSEITKREQKGEIRIMPCLRFLSFHSCPKLTALPDYICQTETLEELKIHQCPILDKRYEKSIGMDWSKISHIPCIINDQGINRRKNKVIMPRLSFLTIHSCPAIKALPETTSLKKLHVHQCPILEERHRKWKSKVNTTSLADSSLTDNHNSTVADLQ